jgi:hypothetical protein
MVKVSRAIELWDLNSVNNPWLITIRYSCANCCLVSQDLTICERLNRPHYVLSVSWMADGRKGQYCRASPEADVCDVDILSVEEDGEEEHKAMKLVNNCLFLTLISFTDRLVEL